MTLPTRYDSRHKSLHTMSSCHCSRCVLGEVLATLVVACCFAAGTFGVLMLSRWLGWAFRGQ